MSGCQSQGPSVPLCLICPLHAYISDYRLAVTRVTATQCDIVIVEFGDAPERQARV